MQGARVLLMGVVLAFGSLCAGAQHGKIAGEVKDTATGVPLVGANVAVKGLALGAAADAGGRYVIEEVASGTYTVVVSMMGYEEKSKGPIRVRDGETATVDFALTQTSIPLRGVVVTATKSEKSLMDAPGSISIVTNEEIEGKNVKDVDEALRLVPGVYDRRRKGFADIMPTISMRGIYGVDRNLILIDGQPVSEDVWRRFPIDLIGRVEVVKGPFSALYGSGAMGGVVNVVTKRPGDRFKVRISSGIEDYNTQTHQLLSSGKLGDFGFSISARKRETDGYASSLVVKSAKEDTGALEGAAVTGYTQTTDKFGDTRWLIGDCGRNWYNDDSYSVKASYGFSPVSRIQLMYAHTEYEYGYKDGKSYLTDSTGSEVKHGKVSFYDSAAEQWRYVSVDSSAFESTYGGNPIDMVNFSAETRVGDVTMKGSLGYDSDMYWWASPPSSWGDPYVRESPREKRGGELLVSLPLFSRQLLSCGVEARETKCWGEARGLSDWQDRTSRTDLIDKNEGRISVLGLYVQDEIRVIDPLTLFAGGRYDYWRTSDGYHHIVKYDTTCEYNYDTRNAGRFSPRIAVVYKASENTRVRFSAGQSFRGPTPHEMYSAWEGISYGKRKVSLGNPDLEPENVISGEIGFEQVWGNRTVVNATYFQNRMDDYIYTKKFTTAEIDDYNVRHGTDYYEIGQKQNIAEARSEGVEIEAKTMLSKSLTVFVNCTAMGTEVLKNPRAKTPEERKAYEGKRIPNVPEATYNLGMDYGWKGLKASVVGRYVGKVYSTDDNSDIATGVFGGYCPFFSADAKVSYRLGIGRFSPKLSLTCDNILDEEHYQYYRSPGRTLGAHLSVEGVL